MDRQPGIFIRTVKLVTALAPTDLANITREAVLLFLISLPLLLAVILRVGLPNMEAMLSDRLAFDLAPYHPMIMGIFVGLAPSLIGAVYGLLLVDERDERTLSVVRVMPTPFGAYLAARLLLPAALSAGVTVLTYPLAGITPLSPVTVAVISLSAATIAPVAALAIIAFARNKVTALVIFRLVNTLVALPCLAFIAAPNWEWPAFFIPSYWPMKSLWLAASGESPALALLGAPLINGVLVFLLYRRVRTMSET